MNQVDGDVQRVTRANKEDGFIAKVRMVTDGELQPLKSRGGKPIIYTTEALAWAAVVANLLKYINGNLLRAGEIAGQTNKVAEGAFKAPLRQKGKTRIISVNYKGMANAGKGTHRPRNLCDVGAVADRDVGVEHSRSPSEEKKADIGHRRKISLLQPIGND